MNIPVVPEPRHRTVSFAYRKNKSIGEPNTNAFVQLVDSRGITYRLDARNATSNLQCRERQRYIGRVSAGILEEIESQCATSGRVVSLKVNGTF